MKWTFGIVTIGNAEENIRRIHDSIMGQHAADDFEIIIVGGNDMSLPKVRHLPFNESERQGWITKKKNLIAQEATHNNICLMHDYVFLYEDWYKNFEKFGDDWDVCMNSIINLDGQRFRDWITCHAWCPEGDIIFLDYDDWNRTQQMYISGTYFCIKKKFLLENPLDEKLSWGQGEDVLWSRDMRTKWNYKCNGDSKVGLLKKKPNDHWYHESNKRAREIWAQRGSK
jgi:hypothetical protein